MVLTKENYIQKIIDEEIENFSNSFKQKHIGELENREGIINTKTHSPFIKPLGGDVLFYNAIFRSFDVSFYNTIKKIAVAIAELSFEVSGVIQGELHVDHIEFIKHLLNEYENKEPSVFDYKKISQIKEIETEKVSYKNHYYLIHKDTQKRYILSINVTGDMDSQRARKEKGALLKEYAVLSNKKYSNIKIHFCTLYNLFGDGKRWKQKYVKKYFAEEELLIGSEFWNFICDDVKGYEIVIESFHQSARHIRKALNELREKYMN